MGFCKRWIHVLLLLLVLLGCVNATTGSVSPERLCICPGDVATFTCSVEEPGGIFTWITNTTTEACRLFSSMPQSQCGQFIGKLQTSSVSTLTATSAATIDSGNIFIQCHYSMDIVGNGTLLIAGTPPTPIFRNVTSGDIQDNGDGDTCNVTLRWTLSEPDDCLNTIYFRVTPDDRTHCGSCEVGPGDPGIQGEFSCQVVQRIGQSCNYTVYAVRCGDTQNGVMSQPVEVHVPVTSSSLHPPTVTSSSPPPVASTSPPPVASLPHPPPVTSSSAHPPPVTSSSSHPAAVASSTPHPPPEASSSPHPPPMTSSSPHPPPIQTTLSGSPEAPTETPGSLTLPTSSLGALPTTSPGALPTTSPGALPTTSPGALPTSSPGALPTTSPGALPTTSPGALPTSSPGTPILPTTSSPGALPTTSPGTLPTSSPGTLPTSSPGALPTTSPGALPTSSPGDVDASECSFCWYYILPIMLPALLLIAIIIVMACIVFVKRKANKRGAWKVNTAKQTPQNINGVPSEIALPDIGVELSHHVYYADPDEFLRKDNIYSVDPKTENGTAAADDSNQIEDRPEDHIPTYADPRTIKREAAPETGDAYTLVDMSKKNAKNHPPVVDEENPYELVEIDRLEQVLDQHYAVLNLFQNETQSTPPTEEPVIYSMINPSAETQPPLEEGNKNPTSTTLV